MQKTVGQKLLKKPPRSLGAVLGLFDFLELVDLSVGVLDLRISLLLESFDHRREAVGLIAVKKSCKLRIVSTDGEVVTKVNYLSIEADLDRACRLLVADVSTVKGLIVVCGVRVEEPR